MKTFKVKLERQPLTGVCAMLLEIKLAANPNRAWGTASLLAALTASELKSVQK